VTRTGDPLTATPKGKEREEKPQPQKPSYRCPLHSPSTQIFSTSFFGKCLGCCLGKEDEHPVCSGNARNLFGHSISPAPWAQPGDTMTKIIKVLVAKQLERFGSAKHQVTLK
jgi:hypothetical protein